MQTRYGQSPWIAGYPRRENARRYPRLRGEHETEVVIVGAGLTGCATAVACALAGLRPLVIEADRAGHGRRAAPPGCCCPTRGPRSATSPGATGFATAKLVFGTWRRGGARRRGSASAALDFLRARRRARA